MFVSVFSLLACLQVFSRNSRDCGLLRNSRLLSFTSLLNYAKALPDTLNLRYHKEAHSTHTSVKSFREVAGVKTSKRPITCKNETNTVKLKTEEQRPLQGFVLNRRSKLKRDKSLTFSCFICLSSRSSL